MKNMVRLFLLSLVFFLAPPAEAAPGTGENRSYREQNYSPKYSRHYPRKAVKREIRSNERRIRLLEKRRARLSRNLYYSRPRQAYRLRLEISRLEREIYGLRLRNRHLYRLYAHR